MVLSLTKLGAAMAIAAEDIDLAAPIAAADSAALRRALLDNLVLCIRGQSLAPTDYLAAMRGFGQPATQVRIASRHQEIPEIIILSSEDREIGRAHV